jgi:hypothetical protein
MAAPVTRAARQTDANTVAQRRERVPALLRRWPIFIARSAKKISGEALVSAPLHLCLADPREDGAEA